MPELSKHRKRQNTNINLSILKASAMSLFQHLQTSFWKNPPWQEFQQQVETLARNVLKYTEYFASQNKTMKEIHARPTPVRQLSDALSIKYIPPCDGMVLHKFDLSKVLQQKNCDKYIFLNDYIPDQARRWYDFLQSLTNNGLQFPIMYLTYSPGNNVGNLSFVWHLSPENSVEESFQHSLAVVEKIKPELPQFHTRAMRKTLLKSLGEYVQVLSQQF